VLKNTRTGTLKFEPVMRMVWPPAGRPTVGLTDEIVGAVLGGGVTIGVSRKLIETIFATLLTVARTWMGPTSLDVSVTVATPLVVVLTVDFTSPLASNVPPVVSN
jgi:hypothetical protein